MQHFTHTTGFPSPTEDHDEATLDLNDLVVRHPAATFFMQMDSQAMAASGIHTGDVLVVDRSLTPTPGQIVVAAYQDTFLVRRYQPTARGYVLLSDDDAAGPSARVNERVDCEIWGVVTHVVHRTL